MQRNVDIFTQILEPETTLKRCEGVVSLNKTTAGYHHLRDLEESSQSAPHIEGASPGRGLCGEPSRGASQGSLPGEPSWGATQ